MEQTPSTTPWIALLGYRACGKSTLGQRLARHLHLPFADLDHLIEDRAGCSIAEIFANAGESKFRDLESEVLRDTLQLAPHVLAPGGGVILREANRALLRRIPRRLYLRVPASTLVQRLEKESGRPALTSLSLHDEVRTLLEQRDPWYTALATQVLEIGANESLGATWDRLRAISFAVP